MDDSQHTPTSSPERGAAGGLPYPNFTQQNGPQSSAETGNVDENGQHKAKPKQKRNKPTLSCLECVERKTKCDRGRPCVACVKRQSSCEYTAVANLILSADRKGSKSKARCVTKPSKARTTSISTPRSTSTLTSSTATDAGWPSVSGRSHRPSHSSISAASPFLFSNVPYSQNAPSNVFGVGSQHPFSNYWTCAGGLPEVITVLPSKDQADLLIAKFFEAVDPIIPFLHRRTFYSDYELFWAMSVEDRGKTDASLVALHYAMYALGTQFTTFTSFDERSQTAEFYCSAANQALRVYSYLNRTSMTAIQAMVLIAYFLMNDNHASDAYAWAGIHLRQSYAMRLHRDPEIAVPDASALEKQQRRKLWQAVLIQDTFLTILLKLPPTATHCDVAVESLADENELGDDGIELCLGSHSRVENLMSINAMIAPPQPLAPAQPHHLVDVSTMKSDLVYMRSMWHLANIVQENLCSPMSLSLPVANNPKHKESLVAAFKKLHKSFPSHLTILDFGVLQQNAITNPRAVRQNLTLTSTYYHSLAILQASENAEQGVETNVNGALEAAHEALCVFFKLWGLFEIEAGVWWILQHRAFEESLLIADLLTLGPRTDPSYDQIFRNDIRRMLELMARYGDNVEIHQERKKVLESAFEKLTA